MTKSKDYPAYIDRFDKEVVGRMKKGKVYNVETIRKAYKQYSGISKDRTAKERTDNLVQSPAFENTAIGRFRFLGCIESDLL